MLSSTLRHETKLPLHRGDYQELRPAMIALGLYPRRTYGGRVVHSIYLDTRRFDDYHDSVSGMSTRSKTRFRWYGDNVESMALEIKRKKNRVSDKHVIQINNTDRALPRDQISWRKDLLL